MWRSPARDAWSPKYHSASENRTKRYNLDISNLKFRQGLNPWLEPLIPSCALHLKGHMMEGYAVTWSGFSQPARVFCRAVKMLAHLVFLGLAGRADFG